MRAHCRVLVSALTVAGVAAAAGAPFIVTVLLVFATCYGWPDGIGAPQD